MPGGMVFDFARHGFDVRADLAVDFVELLDRLRAAPFLGRLDFYRRLRAADAAWVTVWYDPANESCFAFGTRVPVRVRRILHCLDRVAKKGAFGAHNVFRALAHGPALGVLLQGPLLVAEAAD